MLEKIIIFILLIICSYELVFDFKNFVNAINFIFEAIFIELIKFSNLIFKIFEGR
jgi:hypothetical protein